MALITASVPEETILTLSMEGTASTTIWANLSSNDEGAPKLVPFWIVSDTWAITSSLACPKIKGPHEQT